METEGMRRALNFLEGEVSISEIVTDASQSIMALLGEFSSFLQAINDISYLHMQKKIFSDYYHPLDVWHKSKKLKKSLLEVSGHC